MRKKMESRVEEYLDIMPQNTIITASLRKIGFFTQPAGYKHRSVYEGGLFDHSLEVTKQLVNLTEKLGLTWARPESPYIVGMYHDLCKCDDYKIDFETGNWFYDPDFPGHGDKSVIMLQRYIELTEEEIYCIRWHMGAFEKDPKMWEYYSQAIQKYPNVLYTHTADMIASKIVGV